MRALSIFRIVAFRIVLVYVAIFAVSTAALLAFIYWNTERALDAETDQTIAAEITGLSEQYQRLGLTGLTDVLISRSARGAGGLYLLTDKAKHPIAGNLDGWPQISKSPGDFVEFDYERHVGGVLERHRARGRTFTLTGGFQLLVARDVHERFETERLFTTALPWSIALMLVLGLVGGAFMSRNLLQRLDTINRTSREIMAGDLSRRVPVTSADDEFDTLAKNLNRMLMRIEQLMRGMRQVTDSIAHDLRSPLNRLRNRLEGALTNLDPASVEAGELEAAIVETDQLLGTFNALLLIAEAEAGLDREKMTLVDLRAIAEGVADLYEPVADERGMTLAVLPGPGPTVEGNSRLIQQALANLIDNAIKYGRPSATVHISVGETSQGASLTVADTGPGIPPDQYAHVVERFVRLEESRNSPGTGLGLSLVSAVARLHHARLELADNNPGLRVTITFSGPVPHTNAEHVPTKPE